MEELLAHAMTLGVTVATACLPDPLRGLYDWRAGMVVYDYRLTPIERRCVLAHELGHVYYGHTQFGDQDAEDAADVYAAWLLIDPDEYVAAELIDPSPAAIAEELGVEARIVQAWESRLLRVRGVSYVRPRLGAGQFDWRGFR